MGPLPAPVPKQRRLSGPFSNRHLVAATLSATNTQSDPGTSENTAATEAKLRAAHLALAEEHAQIISLLEILKHTPDPALLVRRLEGLHTLLINHFAREQFPGGLYESMGALGSRWHDDLRGLIQDHCLILSESRALLEHARKASPAARKDLQADVNALVEQLLKHERKEHRLAKRLQSAALGDGAQGLGRVERA